MVKITQKTHDERPTYCDYYVDGVYNFTMYERTGYLAETMAEICWTLNEYVLDTDSYSLSVSLNGGKFGMVRKNKCYDAQV